MRTEYKVILTALLVGASVWVLAAAVDYLFFYEEPFLDLLILDVPVHGLYMRSLILVSCIILGTVAAIYADKQRRSAAALRESERSLNTMMSNLPGMAYRCRNDKDWAMEFVSEGSFGLTGYRPADLTEKGTVAFGQLIHPDDRDMVWNDVQEALRKKEPFQLIYRIRTAGGDEKWVWEQGCGVFSADGGLIALEGFITDITERKRVEKTLRESERKFRNLIESSHEVIFSKDLNGRYHTINLKAAIGLGCTCIKDVEGKTDYGLLPKEQADALRKVDKEVIESGKDIEIEEIVRNVQGEDRTYLSKKWPSYDNKGRIDGVNCFAMDITQRKEAEAALRQKEEQLFQAQKMEAIGRLAGGIAHDFNNLLTIILGNSKLAKRQMPADGDLAEILEEIISSSKRAAELTKQLLAFARKGKKHTVAVDIHKLLAEAVGLLERGLDKRIEIKLKLNAEQFTIAGDPVQLQTAFLNLGLNARDAMGEGGRMVFATQTVALDEKTIGRHHYKLSPGRYMQVSVSDTGVGMDEQTRQRVFEPFFTTKEAGEGTGLGLASVYGCVESHNGSIYVTSKPGRGTTFKALLPLVNAPAKASRQESSRQSATD